VTLRPVYSVGCNFLLTGVWLFGFEFETEDCWRTQFNFNGRAAHACALYRVLHHIPPNLEPFVRGKEHEEKQKGCAVCAVCAMEGRREGHGASADGNRLMAGTTHVV
jgi:hypothetical protein